MSIFEPDHAVHAGRQFGIMGGDQGTQICTTRELQQHIEHFIGRVWIEVPCRLVSQQ